MTMRSPALFLLSTSALVAAPAAAQTVTLKPIVDARLRWEQVDQDGLPRTSDAVTARIRTGVAATSGRWSALAEAQGNLAIVPD